MQIQGVLDLFSIDRKRHQHLIHDCREQKRQHNSWQGKKQRQDRARLVGGGDSWLHLRNQIFPRLESG
jgi:hypothetical protein